MCILQLKTSPASDSEVNLESASLTTGNCIYFFDDEHNHGLVSYICADALNQDIVTQRKDIQNSEVIILHPQLNPKPMHASFQQMRKNFLDYAERKIRLISVNWARETLIEYGDDSEIEIEAIYKFNKKFYAKYIIINLLSGNQNEEWLEEIISNDFNEFQIRLLRDMYFDMIGDTRYNLYLIFLVEEQSNFLNNVQLQQDFYFARMLVLAKSEIENYFTRKMFVRHQIDSGQWYESEKKEECFLSQELDNMAQLMFGSLMVMGGLEENIQDESIKKFLYLHNKLKRFNRDIHYKNNEKDYKYNEFPKENFRIEKILSANIENFRCFEGKVAINFNKVNLIYGENGVGKTSLLEALEWALTGGNKSKAQENEKQLVIAKCINQKGKIQLFDSQNVKIELAEDWYGRKVNSKEEFNKLFNKYNHFDTKGASSFAIEGREQINIQQMRHFLGVEYLYNFIDIKSEIIRICHEMINSLKQQEVKKRKLKGFRGIMIRPSYKEKLIKAFREEMIKLEKHEMQNISEIKEESMNIHIAKIEKIFKMLICTYEYSGLKIMDNEVVGIKSGDGEAVSMSRMSTGQKVCLALSFMFALSLSSENSPNIIMLDEPVANLDDIHMLNLLDVLRRFSINNTQIFFTTANSDVAKLFRRKFSFLENEFGLYKITETQNSINITQEIYSLQEEEPIKVSDIYNTHKF